MSTPSQSKPLSRRKKKFVEHFVESGNTLAAVGMAGYSASHLEKTASTLLMDPEVVAAIKTQAQTAAVSHAEALMRLTQIGRGSMQSFLQLTATATGPKVRIDLSSEEAQQNLHLIKSVTQQRYVAQTEHGEVEVVETGVELHCPMQAIDMIIQLLGAYPAKKYDHTTNGKKFSASVVVAAPASESY